MLIVAPGAVALVFLIERIRRRTLALVVQAAVIVTVAAGCALSSKRSTPAHPYTPRAVASYASDPRSQRTLGRLILPQFAWADLIPENSRVGVDPVDVPNGFVYALFGTDFRNDVIGLPRRELTDAKLLDSLRREHIDYFVTRRDSPRDATAQENSDMLDLVSDIGDVRVYRITG